MTIDLVIVSVIGIFALIGAASGAAKQVANLAGLALAYVAARPAGNLLGPMLAPEFKVPVAVGIVAATILVFIVVLIASRVFLTMLLQRILAGRDPDSRTLDRALGFMLGGVKVALIAWILICALTFVEENVTFAGRKLGVSPKSSHAFALAREYNIFELTQFAPVKDLVRVAHAASDPKSAEKLKDDPAYQKLRKDPRFKEALNQARLRSALQSGDYQALLKSNVVMQLIQDPEAAAHLRTAAQTVE